MKLTQGYQRLVQKLKAMWEHANESDKSPSTDDKLDDLLGKSKHYLEVLQELTQEEIHLIQEAVKHDIEQWHLVREHYPGSPLFLAAKSSLWSWLMSASDRNQLEWEAFQVDLKHQGRYQAGEIVNLCILECEQCQSRFRIKHPQALTRCQVCGHDYFRKLRQPRD